MHTHAHVSYTARTELLGSPLGRQPFSFLFAVEVFRSSDQPSRRILRQQTRVFTPSLALSAPERSWCPWQPLTLRDDKGKDDNRGQGREG